MKAYRVVEQDYAVYDQYITSHPEASFLQSRQWADFQTAVGVTVFQYIFKNESTIVGAAQVFLKNISGLNKQYIYCPYGPVTNLEVTDLTFFIDQLKNDFSDILFIRLEPKQNFKLNGIKTIRIQPKDTIINNLTKSTDELLAGMHQKTRYNIKVAQKHGVHISIATGDQEIEHALDLFKQTSARQNFKDFPISYYKTLIKTLGQGNHVATIYQATYNNTLIASALMIDFAGTRTYLYGGSSDSYRNVMAPYLLHFQAMQDAKNKGLEKYDWWGLRTSEGKVSGFTEFKLRFGGTEISYPNAVDIVSKPAWYTVYTVLRKLNRFFLHLPFLKSK